MSIPESSWEKNWREFEVKHMGREDVVMENDNEGIRIYGTETRRKMNEQMEALRIRRMLCHEDEPVIIY